VLLSFLSREPQVFRRVTNPATRHPVKATVFSLASGPTRPAVAFDVHGRFAHGLPHPGGWGRRHAPTDAARRVVLARPGGDALVRRHDRRRLPGAATSVFREPPDVGATAPDPFVRRLLPRVLAAALRISGSSPISTGIKYWSPLET